MTGSWVPKMVPKILQLNLVFCAVFATLGKPGGACSAAESIKKARQDASSPALELSTLHTRVIKNAAHIVLFIVNSASPNNRTNQGSGQKCYF